MACHLEDILTAFTEKYRKNKVLTSCLAEATGTFLLVFFGLGFTANAVLVNAPIDLFGGAFLWGLALTLGIYVTASISTGMCPDREWEREWLAKYVGRVLAGQGLAGSLHMPLI